MEVSRQEYNSRMREIIERDKSSFLHDVLGWKCVIDSYRINFDGKIVYVKYHLIEGERPNPRFVITAKAEALKGVFSLFEQHYYYIIPDGFEIIFEGSEGLTVVKNMSELNKITDDLMNRIFSPEKYMK